MKHYKSIKLGPFEREVHMHYTVTLGPFEIRYLRITTAAGAPLKAK